MANRTVKEATSIKGTNPQYLVEKIIRTRIYDSQYWKEKCFALSAELLVDEAMSLDHIGGVYGGNIKPTPFLCLILKMLQIQPSKDIVIEFIKNPDYKYVRALGCMYLRLVGTALECYKYLEPLYNDYRKMKLKNRQGKLTLSHMDEFIDDLLRNDRVCDVILPRIQKRHVLEELEQLEPRVSALDDDLEGEESDQDEDEEGRAESEEDDEVEYRRRSRSPRSRHHHSRSPRRRSHSRSRSPYRDRSRSVSPHYRKRRRSYSRSPVRHSRHHRRSPSPYSHSSRYRRSSYSPDNRRDRYGRDYRDEGDDHRSGRDSRHGEKKDKHKEDKKSKKDKSSKKEKKSRKKDKEKNKEKDSKSGKEAKTTEELEIQEANELRAKLGLKPLR